MTWDNQAYTSKLNLSIFCLPLGIGLWRRNWLWRRYTLGFVWLGCGLLLFVLVDLFAKANGVTLLPYTKNSFELFGWKAANGIQATWMSAGLFLWYGALLAAIHAALMQPDVKAHFEEQPRKSPALLESLTAIALALFAFGWLPNQAGNQALKLTAPRISHMTSAPFSATIEQGSVELVALGHKPWTNTACWLPNGEISKTPFPNEDDHSGVWDGSRPLTLAFRIRNEGSNAISEPIFRVDKDTGISPGNSGIWAPTPAAAECFQRFDNLKNAQTMNVTIGVANGPWDFFRPLGKGGPFVNKAESSYSEKEGTWGSACNTSVLPGGDVAITCDYTKPDNWATRMVAVDKDGSCTVIPENPSRYSPNQSSGFLLVTSNKFAGIKEFHLQRRKYRWVEFRNISLQPGLRTTVSAMERVQ